MSMKSVELQFALHRMDDATFKQQKLLHKPIHDQTQLADATARNIELERHVTSKTNETIHSHVSGEGEEGKKRENRPSKKKGKEDRGDQLNGKQLHDHPFKGRNIDLSL